MDVQYFKEEAIRYAEGWFLVCHHDTLPAHFSNDVSIREVLNTSVKLLPRLQHLDVLLAILEQLPRKSVDKRQEEFNF